MIQSRDPDLAALTKAIYEDLLAPDNSGPFTLFQKFFRSKQLSLGAELNCVKTTEKANKTLAGCSRTAIYKI